MPPTPRHSRFILGMLLACIFVASVGGLGGWVLWRHSTRQSELETKRAEQRRLAELLRDQWQAQKLQSELDRAIDDARRERDEVEAKFRADLARAEEENARAKENFENLRQNYHQDLQYPLFGIRASEHAKRRPGLDAPPYDRD